ncbi:hypothetical protein [Halocynthiibacter styelae]|uniref:Uncharacterized protein n=1 Tax=Halocynthiibacter styelae TaxID=2761955 RepID=A0A8J7IVY8_9RHOB|nr:hypothetical protein [Paenihalocynthiibacter styelae]MBI1493698.1 hypothetical protein [Paenihalocynthiibacter styelae]
MRDFFIGAFEKLIAVVIVLMGIGVLIGSVIAFSTPSYQGGGALPGFLMLFGGAIYLIMFGGMSYLFLGIYHNTKRTADALENKSS